MLVLDGFFGLRACSGLLEPLRGLLEPLRGLPQCVKCLGLALREGGLVLALLLWLASFGGFSSLLGL